MNGYFMFCLNITRYRSERLYRLAQWIFDVYARPPIGLYTKWCFSYARTVFSLLIRCNKRRVGFLALIGLWNRIRRIGDFFYQILLKVNRGRVRDGRNTLAKKLCRYLIPFLRYPAANANAQTWGIRWLSSKIPKNEIVEMISF